MEKFLFSILTMCVCLWADSMMVSLLVILLMGGISVYKGGIPLFFYIKLMLLPFSFLLIGIITIAVDVGGDSSKMPLYFTLWGNAVGFTVTSLNLALRIFFKALGAVSSLYFLSLNTPMVEILSVLKRLRLPALMIELMSLIYRFIFVIIETADMIFISQSSRMGYRDIKTGYRSMAQLISALFIRSYKRSNDLYTALEARGYQGELNVLEEKYSVSKGNIAIILLVNIGLIAITLVLRNISGGWM